MVLPVIDIAPLYGADKRAKKQVADALGRAARDIGFFLISGHNIDLDHVEQTYQAAMGFFAMPDKVKRKYYIGLSYNHRGYVPFTEKGDYPDEVNRNYEAFDLGHDLCDSDPDYRMGKLLVGPNTWPKLADFKPTVGAYIEQVSQLGFTICTALEMHLNVPKGSLTHHMSKPISQLRLLHYVRGAQTKKNTSVNMGAHTDYECLTLLHTRNEGLQVMTQKDEWIDVPARRDTYVVNIGDMLEAWTNGVFKSTPHRVLNLSPERYSMPYFVAPNHDTVIEPLKGLVTKARPAKYESFRAGDHLEHMLMRDFPYLKARKNIKGDAPIRNPFETRL